MNNAENTPASPLGALEELKKLGQERFGEFKVLVSDLLKYMSFKDMVTLFFPPALGLNILQGSLGSRARTDDAFNIDHFDEDMLASVLNLARWLSNHYFSTDISHLDRLPDTGPVLIVGNHSAGLMPLDALFAIDAVRNTHGKQRRIYSLVHDFAYMAPRVGRLARRIGTLRAKPGNARAALDSGHHVLVYPGGDQDAFRTFQERKKIVLAGRKGFVRLAMEAGVPIVPLVSVGLHESFFVFSKGETIAKKLGLREHLRTDILPFALSFPWGFAPAFFPFVPLPTSIEMEFCEPIAVSGSSLDDDAVQAIYDQVEKVMQETMDRLYENRIPLMGR